MIVSYQDPRWWYLEIPRTGTTTMDRGMRRIFPHTVAIYGKHWPMLPPEEFADALSIVSVRNPYSRAVSCWQFFTQPGEVSFNTWVRQRLEQGFTDVQVEAQPQALWFNLNPCWDAVIRQENFDADFWAVARRIAPEITEVRLERFNDINGPWVNRVRARTHRDRPWQEYYHSALVDAVRRLYAADFEALEQFYPLAFPG